MDSRDPNQLSVGLITVCTLIIVSGTFNALSLIASFYMKDISYSTLLISKESLLSANTHVITSLVANILMILSSIFILLKKKTAIYIYFLTTICNAIYEMTLNNFTFSSIMLAIVFPIFLAFFISRQKSLFGFNSKGDLVT